MLPRLHYQSDIDPIIISFLHELEKIGFSGDIETPVIGSPAGVRTIIRAAVDPFVEREVEELTTKQDELTTSTAALVSRAKALFEACHGQPDDRLRKLAEQIRQNKQRLEELEQKVTELTQQMAETCTGTILIRKTIYPGCVLSVGTAIQVVDHEMTGPLQAVAVRREGEDPILSFRAPADAPA